MWAMIIQRMIITLIACQANGLIACLCIHHMPLVQSIDIRHTMPFCLCHKFASLKLSQTVSHKNCMDMNAIVAEVDKVSFCSFEMGAFGFWGEFGFDVSNP
jgi:hypothetical protein